MFSPLNRWRVVALLTVMLMVLSACAAERPEEPGTAEADRDAASEEGTEAADAEATDAADDEPSDTASEDVADAEADAADEAIPGPPANLRRGCATEDLDVDWFPEKVSFDHAGGISVEYDQNVKVVTIDKPNDAATEPFTLVMLQCGTTLPDDVTGDAVVEVPISRAATYSTTFLQGFELVDAIDTLVAHGGLGFVSSEAVLAAAEAGAIVEVGDQSAPDLEALVAADPDVIMVSAGFSGVDPTEPFAALDIPVVPNASYIESDPVGRAEWMKLEAMLLNRESDIVQTFDGIADAYADLLALTADVDEADRPTVLTSAPFEGIWYASGGGTYTATLIQDAGGAYVFADQEGTAVQLDLEAVLELGKDADIWLAAGSVSTSPDDFASGDERLAEFDAFPDAVWANDADLGPNGGNRFFEDGAVRPDLVLADVISILHPDLLPDHERRFYGQLGSSPGGQAGAGG